MGPTAWEKDHDYSKGVKAFIKVLSMSQRETLIYSLSNTVIMEIYRLLNRSYYFQTYLWTRRCCYVYLTCVWQQNKVSYSRSAILRGHFSITLFKASFLNLEKYWPKCSETCARQLLMRDSGDMRASWRVVVWIFATPLSISFQNQYTLYDTLGSGSPNHGLMQTFKRKRIYWEHRRRFFFSSCTIFLVSWAICLNNTSLRNKQWLGASAIFGARNRQISTNCIKIYKYNYFKNAMYWALFTQTAFLWFLLRKYAKSCYCKARWNGYLIIVWSRIFHNSTERKEFISILACVVMERLFQVCWLRKDQHIERIIRAYTEHNDESNSVESQFSIALNRAQLKTIQWIEELET